VEQEERRGEGCSLIEEGYEVVSHIFASQIPADNQNMHDHLTLVPLVVTGRPDRHLLTDLYHIPSSPLHLRALAGTFEAP
jgi:hypothetical protein